MSEGGADVGPAGDWLLDNYHVVQEHITEVTASLPRGYYRELPELSRGTLTGYPRVYELAISLISHTEGRIDLENVDAFVGAFQEISQLSLGELWAIPAMLRLGLLESVRRMALRTVQWLDEVQIADSWAARIQAANAQGSLALGESLREFVGTPHTLTPVFVSRFLTQLRLATGPFPPLVWLESWISDEGLSAEEASARSTQRMALTQLMMANSITSLRAIARRDWRSFVEHQSVVEQVLRDDPAGFYAQQTFATRDQYRHVVERIAKRRRLSEGDVARIAVDLARDGMNRAGDDPREGHVGYYLIDRGLAELEEATDYVPPLGERAGRWVHRHPNTIFFGGVALLTVAALLALFSLGGEAARAEWVLVTVVALLPASDIAINVLSQLLTAILTPGRLPKLDLQEHGIPPDARTVVVVPTLFPNVESVHDALEHLEVQFLANREQNLHFAILSDFTDAATERVEGDDQILHAAIEGIAALNTRYCSDSPEAFSLFHRSRLWNPVQGVWMGWERKRGKLAAFNQYVRGGAPNAFSTVTGDVSRLREVRYVITLDSDTVLPPDAATALIGTIAHPLNVAQYDDERGLVVRGYGIIQPRVGVSLPSAHRSRFATIHSGHPGVDPYTTAVSDVYQDLYGEGSFTGKGIYDVDAFELATHGRFPENTLLSHDLIEGNYARAGLATDIVVYDEYPSRYLTYTRRKHRWIRGDWQLLRWLTGRVPGPDGEERNRLTPLSRWKIFDNLRRSIVEIAQLVFLLAGWTVLPGSPLKWTLLGLGAVAAPWIVALLIALIRPPADKSWRAYYETVREDAVTSALQLGQAIAFLPHQAFISLDAIVRTLYRMFVSKRYLLEWQTASQTERSIGGSTGDIWRTMWPAVATPLAVIVAIALSVAWTHSVFPGGISAFTAITPNEEARLISLAISIIPLALVWSTSPVLARVLSRAEQPDERRLDQAHREAALRYALLHWRFFERFVDDSTNWLAPDNYQDDPSPAVAMRTSPTNIGLQLLSTVSAFDLGFISLGEMTDRLERAFRSMERMARYRGHFFNWYDLAELRVMEPAYISTVDSGNLAGHLIAIRQACLAIVEEHETEARTWRALDSALTLANQQLRSAERFGESATTTQAASELRVARAAVGALSRRSTRNRKKNASTPADAPDHAAYESAIVASLERARSILASAGVVASTPPRTVASLGGPESQRPGPNAPNASMRDDDGSDDMSPKAAARRAVEWIDWSLARIARLQSDSDTAANDGDPRASLAPLGTRTESSPNAATLFKRLETIAERCYELAMAMDFRFLYDDARELFAIGYQTSSHTLDAASYDLLASEARLASFVAIAKDDIPVDHWFRLGRTLTSESGATALISWSGSMFEYLMPVLVMQSFPSTLLGETYQAVVRRQMAYGVARGVPWGVSESAYNLRDRHFTYQYRAFGVPDLALKRGLGRDLVIAPYASVLASMVDLPEAMDNLAALERSGSLGNYGFRDALDYTRPNPGERFAVVQNYMAHHIGMSMVALANVLLHRIWQRRFHADALVQSAELLLHERVPRRLVLQEPQEANPDESLPDPAMERSAVREIDDPNTPQPQIALLGYLPYTVMISHCGGGYSRYEDLAVTRWRSDGTSDDSGQFCYVRDVSTGRIWSTAYQPTCAGADWYRAYLATDRVTFHRADGDIETRTDIAIVPEDAAEVRRVTLTNNGNTPREIELTSYGEIVLGPVDADRAHPAFANLFVETEWHEWCTAITATRRPRSSGESPVHLVHVVDVTREQVGSVSYETDRAHFIGRGGSVRAPIALTRDGSLEGRTGAVLDPILSLRLRISLDPGRSSSVTFTTLVAPTRERAFELAGRYHDPHAGQRALDLTWTATQIELRELNVTPADAAVFQEIAGHLLYSDQSMRADQETLKRNSGSQPRLWSNGISGDWPILLATIDTADGLPTLRQLFAAHRYWRRRGLTIDLVVMNDSAHTYLQDLNDRISETMFSASDSAVIDRPGGVFLRRKSVMDPNDLLMLEATARVHMRCDGRSLARIIDTAHAFDGTLAEDRESFAPVLRPSGRSTPPSLDLVQRVRARDAASVADEPREHAGRAVRIETPTFPRGSKAMVKPRLFENGYGGLLPNGDYEITVRAGDRPPAPWTNVIANSHGGFLVSEGGSGATWAENSYFYRLTPWRNDPVSDAPSDVIYLRDEHTGEFWSATPAPIHEGSPFTVRHGAGSTTFAHERSAISSSLTLGVAPDAAVKLSTLQLTNHDTRPRRISVIAYAEWTLGVLREHTQHQVQTTFDAPSSTLYARNHFDPQFASWVAFASMSETVRSFTGDRREFLGRNGGLRAPAGLTNAALAGSVGAALDPCAALQCVIELAPGERRDVTVILGAAPNEERARALVERYRSNQGAADAIEATIVDWQKRLEVVAVHTPEASFDAMVNRWTLYQALACRMWARSALYQSSGAFGFRDQLQDVMAFVYAEPDIAREHIVRAASRQFLEGDVQHWWHPQSGRGVRTRFSDDLAWLPFVVEHYVRVTGDASVLDDYVPFLSMRPLAPDEHEVYELPTVTEEHGSIYEHCLRALRKACTAGPHQLPLIGTGDWNDGMNRVGVNGKGESVWLAWFLVTTLRRFSAIAEGRGDKDVTDEFRAKADAYVAAIEASAWDGAWYRRAYFDDGTPLGSSQSDECRIDSIAQSWSVISGAGNDDRQRQAMQSLEQHLVRDDAQLIMLLTPPFDKTPNDPGYIKGYLPGVRENGAQYTHAALWGVLATALRGDGDRAFALYQMINPLMHSNTRQEVEKYKVEPYVVAADVYTAQGQLGRGGWTWYTGSASWMYRVALEHILGFTKRGDKLTIAPCIPASWQSFAIDYRFGRTTYAIVIQNPENVSRGVVRVSVDGQLNDAKEIILKDDGARHDVVVTMGQQHNGD